jgi:hypothetical protein
VRAAHVRACVRACVHAASSVDAREGMCAVCVSAARAFVLDHTAARCVRSRAPRQRGGRYTTAVGPLHGLYTAVARPLHAGYDGCMQVAPFHRNSFPSEVPRLEPALTWYCPHRTCAHAHTRTHAHTHAHAHAHARHARTHAHARTHVRARTHTRTHARMQAPIYTPIHGDGRDREWAQELIAAF